MGKVILQLQVQLEFTTIKNHRDSKIIFVVEAASKANRDSIPSLN